MIKKLLALTILAVGLSASACWFTELNFNKAYIARINATEVFIADTPSIEYTTYTVSGGAIGDQNGVYSILKDGNNAPVICNEKYVYRHSVNEGSYYTYLWYLATGNSVWGISSGYYGIDTDSVTNVCGSGVIPEDGTPSLGIYDAYVLGHTQPPSPYPTVSKTMGVISCPPAGTQDLPCQVWVKIQPRSEENAPAISESLLQYKKLPNGSWTTFKKLSTLNWTMDFSKPVQLFGPNIFDPPSAKEGDSYLVRLWFTDGLFENADLDTNAPEGGDTVWRNQWVTKITIGKRRAQ